MEHPSQYQKLDPYTSADLDFDAPLDPMPHTTDDRDLVDRFIDAGSSFDWITPTAEAIRNIAQDGRSFVVLSDDWHALKWQLQRRHIPFWGEALHWSGSNYWVTFSVGVEHAETVAELSGYVPNGGRGKAAYMLLVLAIMAGTVVLVAFAIAGGAL